MLASFFQPHICDRRTCCSSGFVQGLIVSVLAMGIVLIYRSTPRHQLRGRRPRRPRGRAARGHGRAVALPVLARARARVAHHARPPARVVEMVVIRRLAKAPRVIVLVATIGVAELMQAVVRTAPRLPHRQVPDGRSRAR